jgi:hypothetical protein
MRKVDQISSATYRHLQQSGKKVPSNAQGYLLRILSPSLQRIYLPDGLLAYSKIQIRCNYWLAYW